MISSHGVLGVKYSFWAWNQKGDGAGTSTDQPF